jgi:hypothetical protein
MKLNCKMLQSPQPKFFVMTLLIMNAVFAALITINGYYVSWVWCERFSSILKFLIQL